MKLRFFILTCALVWAAGCSNEASVSSGAGEFESTEAETESELNACTYPRRYMAALAEGECTEVVARRGRWVPSPLFEDAPEMSGACFYTWAGEKYARVDREALRAHVEFPGTLMPSCGSERIDDASELLEITDFSPGGMVGAIGCDVCGLHRDGNVWVVLPPEKVHFRELKVKLSSGHHRVFQIQGPASARRMVLTLPPAPPGTTYVNGPVALQ